MRVGGRLKNSNLHFSDVHPLLIGSKSKTISLIVEWCHQMTTHGGRGLTINEVRNDDFWVVKCNTVVRNCGIDMFGPFLIKEGRKQLKRLGALFTY